ncbi:hypothetical protein [uncultured Fenollaria sp.]|uniref:hypothetical protein n=1 Tax=uncultured Fenollaria sp. TaxID=1686315 RepID=UPI0025E71D78|nr:hypothetical protein [uncultured Fenollaria sp.]
MKKYKQILALALVLMLTMTLLACNKEENKETTDKTKTENTEETKTENTEETESEAIETAELPQDALEVEIKKAEALDDKYENAYALLDTADEANKAKYDELYPNNPYKLDIELNEADEPNKANYISLLDNIIKMDRKLQEATPENPYDTARNKGEKVLTEILATEEGKDPIFCANRDLYKFLALELETGDDLKLKDWTIAADETRNVILGYNQKDRYELGKTYEIDYFGNKLKIMPVGVAKEGAKYVNGNGDEISLDNTIIAALNYDDSKALLSDDECKSLVDSAVIISPEADKAMYLGNYMRGAYKAVRLSDLVK